LPQVRPVAQQSPPGDEALIASGFTRRSIPLTAGCLEPSPRVQP
jgi:hypothetical protein